MSLSNKLLGRLIYSKIVNDYNTVKLTKMGRLLYDNHPNFKIVND